MDSTQTQITPNDMSQTPSQPAAPQPTAQSPAQPSAPAPSAQPAGATPILAHAPATPQASLHARLFDGILKNLSGGPIKVMQSDPTTGDTREVEVPRSRSSMANSVLAGVLSSMFSGAQGRGAEPDYKPVMGSHGTQHAEEQAAAQAKNDQMQDRKMKVLKSNLETIQSQMAAARMGDEVMDKQIADGAQQVDLAKKYDEGRQSADEPQSIQATNLNHDQAMAKIGDGKNGWIAVPSGRTSHLDTATGKTVSEPTYTVLDPHVKVKLGEDDVKAMALTNPSLADAWQRSGGNIEIPLDVVNSARLVRAKVNNVQGMVNQLASDPETAKALGIKDGKVGNLMSIAQDKTLRDAINNTEAQMAAHAGGDRHYSILDAMLTSDGGVALAQKMGIDPAKANAWLDSEHQKRMAADAHAAGASKEEIAANKLEADQQKAENKEVAAKKKTMGYVEDMNGRLQHVSQYDIENDTAGKYSAQTFHEVKPSDVKKDTDLVKPLGDVQLKLNDFRSAVNNYDAAVNKGGIDKTHEASDTANLNLLMSNSDVTDAAAHAGAGGFGISIPTVALELEAGKKKKLMDAYNALTPEGKRLADNYAQARAAIPAYVKALTNSGRGSKEQLEIELNNFLPPSYQRSDVHNRIDGMQANLDNQVSSIPQNLLGTRMPVAVVRTDRPPQGATGIVRDAKGNAVGFMVNGKPVNAAGEPLGQGR
jgi:hypothetical protein